ncbi:cobalamin biosynthesis protein CobD [Natronolimnobius sp. AArcel1]|nr:cobalamin biosynthesis protein CobD [Natronolimnobius sp. AArcel1]
MLTTLGVIALACSLDLLVGEPRTGLHPVAWFGRLVDHLERDWSATARGQRLAGVAIAVLAPLVPAGVAAGVVLAGTALHPFIGAVAAGLVLFLTTSLRALLELTETVIAATEGDLETAREDVRGLVGRDASSLSPAEIRSAAVESASENLADGFVATLLPFALFAPLSLPLAAAAAAWVKGVNTLDSMLGYPSKPIGTASAKLDDYVMWIPARVTAVTLAIGGADPFALGRARAWAREPPSPNSGWPMATLACVLSVRLHKPGVYDLNPDANLPTLADGERAITVVGVAAVVAVVVALGVALGTATLGSTLTESAAVTVVSGR